MRIEDASKILAKTYLVFKRNDPLRLAGATAFFTTFALPPILIILIQLFGLILNPAEVSTKIFCSGEILLNIRMNTQ